MADIKGCQSQIETLRSQITAKKYKEASKTLILIKLSTIQFPSMVGQPSETATAERKLCRDALEAAVVLCIHTEDMTAFERNFAQLKPYYTDFRAELGESKQMGAILGLNLMHMLVDNKLSSFHSELELIPPKLRAHPCVKFAVNLERYLMEGSYSKVNALSKTLPTPFFKFLMNKLTETVREEIATCVEVSYTDLSVAEAAEIFNLDPSAMLTFASGKDAWTVDSSQQRIAFKGAQTKVGRRKADIPSHQLIEQALEYAIELERIV